jgi:hypothetical protein
VKLPLPQHSTSPIGRQRQPALNLLPRLLAADREEGLDYLAAIGRQHARTNLHAMIHVRMGKNFKTGLHRAAARLRSSIDQSRHARLNHGAGAHAARFNRYVQRRVRKAVVANYFRRLAQHNNFRMRRGIAITNGAIAGARQYSSFMHQHRADRYFAASRRFTCFS